MRKESLKKDGTKNGTLEEVEIDSTAVVEPSDANNINGDAVDPLDGADHADNNVEAPKKKGKKSKDANVVEVAVPTSTAEVPEEEEDYEVEDIIAHKFEKKKKFFLVRWKNYGADSDTWEPESSLSCPEIIKKYTDAHPDEEKPAVNKKKKTEKKEKKTEKALTPSKKSKRVIPSAVKKADKNEADGENYEVSEIVDHKTERGKILFLIRWKGYSADSDTWEPESTLSCPDIVKKYKSEKMGKSSKPETPAKKLATKAAKKEKAPANEDYEVQLIVGEKNEKGQKFYLVRWKGWSLEHDTWEPETSLSCPDLIKKYKDAQSKKRPAAAKRGNTKSPKYTEDAEEPEEEEDKEKVAKRKPPVEKDYEVEEIVDHKVEKGKTLYLVKWKGWESDSNTWEPDSSLSCPEIVKKYKEKSSQTKAAKRGKPEKKAALIVPSKKSKAKVAKKSAKKTEKSTEDETEWEVEQVIDVKYNDDGSKDFLIRWKGCEPATDTWEPEKNLDCADLINKFMNKVEEVPKKKSRKA